VWCNIAFPLPELQGWLGFAGLMQIALFLPGAARYCVVDGALTILAMGAPAVISVVLCMLYPERFTVFGSSGFVGRNVVDFLRHRGHQVATPGRGAVLEGDLGRIIYCIGVTSEWRRRPFDAADAHVGILCNIVRSCDFKSLVYLSSTRVYRGAADTSEESDLAVRPCDGDDLYNITKLAGETLVLNGMPNGIVVRLSNVTGPGAGTSTFLASLLEDAKNGKDIKINQSPDSVKDYVWIDDTVECLVRIAEEGRQKVYNIASGINISHAEIAEVLRDTFAVKVGFADGAPLSVFPAISIRRIAEEFEFAPSSILDRLKSFS
jgi:nucleoside-diphosphate-sugar epimerase